MIIYLILLIIIIFCTLFIKTQSNSKNKKTYIIITFGVMTLIAALRKFTIGIDLEILYYPKFLQIINIEWSQLESSINLETGYLYFCKFLTTITSDPQILIIVTSLIIFPITGWFIYKYSKNVKISTTLYILLNIYFMSMNIVRQEIAVSLILIAYYFWINNKKIYSIVSIMLASTIHASALIMIPMMMLYGKRFNRKCLIGVFTVMIVLLGTYKFWLYAYSAFSSFIDISNNKDYLSYLQSDVFGVGNINLNSISTCVLTLGMFIISYYYIVIISNKYKLEFDEKQHFYLFMTAIYMIISIVSLKMVIIARLSYYFIPFMLLILPECLYISRNSKHKFMILFILYTFILAKFIYVFIYLADILYGVMPYEFFWN